MWGVHDDLRDSALGKTCRVRESILPPSKPPSPTVRRLTLSRCQVSARRPEPTEGGRAQDGGSVYQASCSPAPFRHAFWHLAERMEYIGGSVSDGRYANTTLQGLLSGIDRIKKRAHADPSYDLNKITESARNMWNDRDQKTDGNKRVLPAIR